MNRWEVQEIASAIKLIRTPYVYTALEFPNGDRIELDKEMPVSAVAPRYMYWDGAMFSVTDIWVTRDGANKFDRIWRLEPSDYEYDPPEPERPKAKLGSWQKVLGVHLDATYEEARAAYHKLTDIHHPDKPGGDSETFRKVKDAWKQAKAELE